ncbi:heparan-alpha-glucosaminide N-acetyltransferase domain-containing protein [Asticcacaulis sp. ZE23SCel15]|uniref:acyltransferase family protein n=1 Tax=Asticcacaulis sp. ZE23SCel15 TaxID=3059027 RepID=UPI00265DD243|nr:heparan-alpha-glucosaminide N-acetyltransferase domain-containing protein [Asticcacaulis sp. ZE23SCel15]WKL56957.1 heparan-alpha-glucosaminide N-acetyltransferase domain-containing protein [Asticcacaulis sp. ZE23SCel15]
MTDTAKPPRLISLDVLRGLTVIGMILVNATAGMKYGQNAEVYPLLLHAHWDGLMIADVVFPAFLMMVGVSIPMALDRTRQLSGLNRDQALKIFWRTFRLFLIGFILANLWWFSALSETTWRFWGVLQRIGLVYGGCAVLFFLCSPKVRIGIIVAILALYWPLTLAPALDGLPNDIWQRGHNFVASVDRIMFGAGNHNYVKGPEGYDPEGLLGTLPALAHGLIGVAIGEYLLGRKGKNSALPLLGAGVAMLAVGIGWAFVFPVIKDIWSSTFVLVTCGITTICLAGIHAVLDTDAKPNAAGTALVNIPLAFGINAIASYVLHDLAAGMVGWQLTLLPYHAAKPLIGEAAAALIPVILFIAFIWLCMDYLRRKKWIIKV